MITPPLSAPLRERTPVAELPVRQRLLRVTSRLVYRNGVSATGVAAITAAAGVAKMSLYRHFPGGKDELVAAALSDQSERAVQVLIASARSMAAADARGPVEVILAIFDVIDATTQRPGWRGCPILNAAAELPEGHAGRAVVVAYKERLRLELVGLLREGGADAATADRLALVLLLLYQGAMSAGGLAPQERPGLLARSVAAQLLASRFGTRNEQ
jgi:AcrR family transcriptional regulator